MQINVSKRLSFKLVRNTVLLALVLGVVLNVIQVTLDYFSASRVLDEDIQALINITHSPASQIAYNIDVRLAEELLEGLLQHPAVVAAHIVDTDGRKLASRERARPDSPYRALSDLLFQERRHYMDSLRVSQLADMDLGELHITVDTYYYGTAFIDRALFTMLSGFIKTLALSGFLLLIFYVLLTKPLLKVIQSIAQVDAEAPEKARLPIPAGHAEDEIGLLVSITNAHLHTIDSSLQRLREAEGQLKQHSEALSLIVAERTRELQDKNEALQRSNRALIQAKEDAVGRARMRATFLANMSHEIRTPLNGLLGMLGLVLEDPLPAAQKARLQIALNAGRSLLDLLNDILDISKVEAGKLQLERIPFSLRQIAEEACTLLSEQARRKGIELITDIAPDLPAQYSGDPTRVRQIINNLLGNGIKFTNEGSVTLRVLNQHDGVRIVVEDTGIGIAADARERIFAPFAQGQTDTTRRYGGTGLGLTLCRQLVERMHGDLRVDSTEHVGSVFTVDLPLPVLGPATPPALPEILRDQPVLMSFAQIPDYLLPVIAHLSNWGIRLTRNSEDIKHPEVIILHDPRQPSATEQLASLCARFPQAHVLVIEHPSGTTHAQRNRATQIHLPLIGAQLISVLEHVTREAPPEAARDDAERVPSEDAGLRVLLVEDNRVNQIVATGMLQKLGHRVDVAENGERALVALKQADYDLVLMDCQMPVMDGFEATRRIREDLNLTELPIIAVTANVMEGDRDACLEAGMNDYMTKPYNRQTLTDTLRRWTHQQTPDASRTAQG